MQQRVGKPCRGQRVRHTTFPSMGRWHRKIWDTEGGIYLEHLIGSDIHTDSTRQKTKMNASECIRLRTISVSDKYIHCQIPASLRAILNCTVSAGCRSLDSRPVTESNKFKKHNGGKKCVLCHWITLIPQPGHSSSSYLPSQIN